MEEGRSAPSGQPTWDRTLEDIEPHGYMRAGESQLFAYGVNLALPLLMVLVFALGSLRWSLRARRAGRTEEQASKPLEPGQAVLRGRVAEVEGGGAAVTVAVTQIGSERKVKGGWRTTWTEVARQVTVRPFYLERQDGSLVRVEPDEGVRLIDSLDRQQRQAHDRRVRWAALDPGETVYALGELVEAADPRAADYRGQSKALVLRSPSSTPMLLSTEPLRDRFAAAARLRRRLSLVLLVLTLGAQALVADYHAARWSGHTAAAEVLERSLVVESRGSNDEEQVATITFQVLPDGATQTQRVEAEDYPHLTEGTVFPVRVAQLGDETTFTVGARATALGVALFIPGVLLVLLMAGFIAILVASRPWYERKRLEDSARGTLAEQKDP